MVLEFLFSAAVGSVITHGLLERMSKVELENMEKKFQQALNYQRQGQYREAISVLEELDKKDPSNPNIYFQLWGAYGMIAGTEKKKVNAVRAVDKALEYHEAILWLVRQGAFVPQDILEGLEKHRATLKMIKDVATGKVRIQDEKAGKYFHKADLAKEAGNYKEALRCINKAIELEKDDLIIARYHIQRAFIKGFLGDRVGAITDCKIASKCKGLVKEERERVEQLVSVLQGKMQAGGAEEYVHKASLAGKAGDYKKALRCIKKAIELETDDVMIAVDTGYRGFIKALMGDIVGGIADCRTALKFEGLSSNSREVMQDCIKSFRKIDRTWNRDLLNQRNTIGERLGDTSGVCSLCGGKRDLVVEWEITICRKCRKKWHDRKVGMVKAAIWKYM